MLILGICGSPNHDGNTAHMLNIGLEEARSLGAETRFINVCNALDDCATPFCVSCSKPCAGICLEGTKMEQVVELLKQADGIMFGTPVYVGTISAPLKALFDKIRYLRGEFALCNVVGGAMAVGHSQYGGEEQAMNAVRDAMLVYGMTVVGNTHPSVGAGHGGCGLADPAKGNEDAKKKMIALTRRIVEVAEATKELRKR